MWRTGLGTRVLRGAEWELFRSGLDSAWEWVEDTFGEHDLSLVDTPAFDPLGLNQKLAMLALVGRALRDEDVPAPELTACTEGTVAAIYRHVCHEIECEIERDEEPIAGDPGTAPDPTSWRRLALDAYLEAEGRVLEELPKARTSARTAAETDEAESGCDELEEDGEWLPSGADSEDLDAWQLLVDAMAHRVLWGDEDFDEGGYVDEHPDLAASWRAVMGITEDYYVAVAPDPTDEQLESIRATLRELCGRPEPREVELIPGLMDLHHDLLVGPCDREAIGREAVCPLVPATDVTSVSEFDCTYDEWLEHFRAEVMRAAEQDTEPTGLAAIPGPEWGEQAARSERLGLPLKYDDGVWIELREGKWVVRDRHDSFLEDPRESCWVGEDLADQVTIAGYATPLEALGAYLWSQQEATLRSARHDEAMRRLGRDEVADQ